MNTYEDLCMSVQRIADTLGLECEVTPMRKYSFWDSSKSKGFFKELRITFHNMLFEKPLIYTYSLSPYIWESLQKSDKEYDAFIRCLTEKVNNSIINI